MPSKKKKSVRPPGPNHTDSLRADIAAASPPHPDDDVDIASELLASLDARDEADAQCNGAADSTPMPSIRKSSLTRPRGTSSSIGSPSGGGGSSSSTGVIGGLKDAGEKLLNHVSPSSPPGPSPIAAQASADNNSDAAAAAAPGTSPPQTSVDTAASTSRRHSIRGIFGHRSSNASEPDGAEAAGGARKVGRQKLRKQRKEAEAAADRARYEEELQANGGKPDEAEMERKGIAVALDSLGVEMHEINPDGHCLYAAVADQLQLHGLKQGLFRSVSSYKGARKVTAQYMRDHPDDFAPFISDSDEHMAGIENSDAGKGASKSKMRDHYLSYCDAIESTGVWGGQPEILAMSRAFQTQIWVVQAGSPIVKVGEGEYPSNDSSSPLMISYHRKMYGLGEHYNSLHPKKH
ncbi:unnamed protein product [Jaminaea pallidilutea]